MNGDGDHRTATTRRARMRRRGGIGVVGALAVATAFGGSVTDDTPVSTPTPDSGITLSMSVEPGSPVPVELLTEYAAAALYAAGHRGQGIDVALIDSGIAPVTGLDQPGKLLHGPDLSNEGAGENVARLDTFGHGTHMAGIIAGDDGAGLRGVASESRIVNVKVADATGAVDIAQVLAAIDWVVEHKNDNGLNIRVLNLSLGIDGVKTNQGDPLSAAVERAWDAGIVVVAAAGNRGNGAGGIDSPAISPYVIAVGGTESYDSMGKGDVMAPWSSGGNDDRTPDVVAPGRSILSLRVPGSMLDHRYPEARVSDQYFRGSGTSQSAAVVTGFTAALLSAYPSLTPDQVKFLYQHFADDIAAGRLLDGSGKVDLAEMEAKIEFARKAPIQRHPRAVGEAAPTVVLQNDPALTDATLTDATLTDATRIEVVEYEPVDTNWTGGSWSGATWSGGSWSGATWSGATWSGATWSGATWSGGVWSGATWSGATWSGATWSGATWSGATWSGATWSGATWSGATWSTGEMTGGIWS